MNLSLRTKRGLSDRGAISVEGAALSLVFVAAFVVSADIVVSLRTRLKLEQVAGNLAANVTQFQAIKSADFTTLFDTAQQMAGPSMQVTGSTGAVIITGITNTNNVTKIVWQQPSPNNTTFTSSFGATGATPTNLPDSYALPSGSSVVAVEVFTTVKPWVLSQNIMGNIVGPMRAVALFQPRAANLPQLAAN